MAGRIQGLALGLLQPQDETLGRDQPGAWYLLPLLDSPSGASVRGEWVNLLAGEVRSGGSSSSRRRETFVPQTWPFPAGARPSAALSNLLVGTFWLFPLVCFICPRSSCTGLAGPAATPWSVHISPAPSPGGARNRCWGSPGWGRCGGCQRRCSAYDRDTAGAGQDHRGQGWPCLCGIEM